MGGYAFRPVRGNWQKVTFNTASAATFGQGALVALNTARDLQEATVGSEKILGIALSSSVNSFPAGAVIVAVPRDGTATFTAPIATNVAASKLSVGQSYTIGKSGNTMLIDTTSQASAYVEIVGPLTASGLLDTALISSTSRVEAVFLTGIRGIPSAASLLVPAP